MEKTETLPNEIQSLISSYRQLNYQMKELMGGLKAHLKNSEAAGSNKVIKRILIEQKELGDQKLELLQRMHEMTEAYQHNNKQNNFNEPHNNYHHSNKTFQDHQPIRAINNNQAYFNASDVPTTHNKNNSNNLNNNSNNNNEDFDGYNFKKDSISNVSTSTRSTNNSNSNNNNNTSSTSNNNSNKFDKIKRPRRPRFPIHPIDCKDDEERGRKKKPRRSKMNDAGSLKVMENVDPDEPVYCLCRQVSYGEMIGCDNEDCELEWFHFRCVSLTHKPKGKWYCPSCRGERQGTLSAELAEKRRKNNE